MLTFSKMDNEQPYFGPPEDLNIEPEKEPNKKSGGGWFGKLLIIVIAVVLISFGASFIVDEIDENVEKIPQILQDPEIGRLEYYEKNKDYVNLLKSLFENTDPEFSKKVLPWLKEREDSGFSPYLYATARHMLITGEPYQGLLYYTAGGLTARIDAARCTDRTTANWVAFIEKGFKGVQEYMLANPASKVAAGKWALMKEESMASRELPEWICLNGENTSKYVPYVSDEVWQAQRAEIREAFNLFVHQTEPEETVAEESENSAEESENEETNEQ